jgi:hypothetical protein
MPPMLQSRELVRLGRPAALIGIAGIAETGGFLASTLIVGSSRLTACSPTVSPSARWSLLPDAGGARSAASISASIARSAISRMSCDFQ